MSSGTAFSLKERLDIRLAALGQQGLRRCAPLAAGSPPDDAPWITLGGRRLLNFTSNDALGLAGWGRWRTEVARCFALWSPSGAASRLAGGYTRVTADAEAAWAELFGCAEAVFFPSGYQANLACLTGLLHAEDTVFVDKRIHASMGRALALTGARIHTFAHADAAHCARRLGALADGAAQPVILTESLFGMDGAVPDMPALATCKARYGAFLIVDEAHALGVWGPDGKGLAQGVADVRVGTLGKALGFFGAFLLLPAGFREYLENLASALIHSTALPPAHAACLLRLAELWPELASRRDRLAELTGRFRVCLEAHGIPHQGQAHIIWVPVGGEARAVRVGRLLRREGVFALAARSPSVPWGQAGLRFGITVRHEPSHAPMLATALGRALDTVGRRNAL